MESWDALLDDRARARARADDEAFNRLIDAEFGPGGATLASLRRLVRAARPGLLPRERPARHARD